MKRGHLETLQPVCPRCKQLEGRSERLFLAWVRRERDDAVLEGALQCPRQGCLAEYPIVDGLPILLPDARAYVAGHFVEIVARADLSPDVDGMLAECCGPGSILDTLRQHVSQYAWEHYGELDPRSPGESQRPGTILAALEAGLALLPGPPRGPALDAGCSVGGTSFALARRSKGLVLGLDLSFSMLRVASRALHEGVVRFALRRHGMLYDEREFPAPGEGRDRVDFWVADAATLPFDDGTFGTSVAYNLLDCVPSPLDLLRSLCRTTAAGGHVLLASPYDWTGAVTPPEAWIGGHSPRADGGGRSEAVLPALLREGAHPAAISGVRVLGQRDDVPWHVRTHERSVTAFRLHVLAAEIGGA